MNSKVMKYLIFFTLFEGKNCFADLSETGQNFGAALLQKQSNVSNDKEVNERLNALPGFQSYKQGGKSQEDRQNVQYLKAVEGHFSANMDRGAKNADIVKSELSKVNAQKLDNAANSTSPSLNQAEELLKQKHRWHIEVNDASDSSNSKEKIEKETELTQKMAAEMRSSPSGDKIITCKKSVKPVTVTCSKRLVITPIPQNKIIKEVKVSYSKGFNELDFWLGSEMQTSVNLKTGSVSTSGCCSNPSVSVGGALGNIDNPDKAVVELISHSHGQNYGGSFALIESPSHTNGFVARFKDSTLFHWFWHTNVNATYVWKITIQPKPKLEEHWEGCELEEKRITESYCQLLSLEQKEKNETKRIDGYPDPVTRDYWLELRKYTCGFGSQVNECQKWQKEGCEQIGSRCVTQKNGDCIEYEQTYRCTHSKSNTSITIPNLPIKEMKEAQDKPVTFDSADFGEAVTGMSALSEMAKPSNGLGGIGGDHNNPSVFNGECQRCSIKLGAAFQNCCDLSGMALGLFGGCREGEKKLAVAAVKDKRCHKVQDKYCTTKILGKCVEEKEAYCCYGSQIAKIIQEIAHHQLNIPWGSGDSPNCGSLTAEQLSRLDFDTPFAQEKLSALIGELQSSAKAKLSKTEQDIKGQSNINNRLEALQKNLKNHFSKDYPTRTDLKNPSLQPSSNQRQEVRK